VIVVVMCVGGIGRCKDPWVGEETAGVGRWDLQPRDPKRSPEGLGACVEGTNHRGDGRDGHDGHDGHRPCWDLWTCEDARARAGEGAWEACGGCGSSREAWWCGGFGHGLLEAGCAEYLGLCDGRLLSHPALQQGVGQR
jgi:hypothetical protein